MHGNIKMIDTLKIWNYRSLERLELNSLLKVNLITGKNNTGKSTILEALASYAAMGDLRVLFELLEERGEVYKQNEIENNPIEYNIKTFSSLFTNRDEKGKIEIRVKEKDESLFSPEEKALSLRIVKYREEKISGANSDSQRKKIILENGNDDNILDYLMGLEIKNGGGSYILPLYEEKINRFGFKGFGEPRNFQFIRPRGLETKINLSLWNNIVLTYKEKFVIEALRIIEPEIDKITFKEDGATYRKPFIKLLNDPILIPLQSMGDGINRILTIILAMVNSDNGYLLIDEFENGLHYSVQERLWEIIFSLSEKLNVQVFATTHSEDCISGFEKTINKPCLEYKGKLVRLENDEGLIKQVEFDKKELKIAFENNIEVR